MPRGRPSKLTPEVQKGICLQLSTGATFETAAEAMGIAANTVGLWMTRGEQEKSGRYRDFLIAVRKSRATVVQRLLTRAQQRVKSKKEGGEGADPLPLLAVIDRRYQPQVRVQVASELNAILDRLEEGFANEPDIFERCLLYIGEETGPGAIAAASSRATGAHAEDGEAVRAPRGESHAADVPGAGG